jgi:hypothetical protein
MVPLLAVLICRAPGSVSLGYVAGDCFDTDPADLRIASFIASERGDPSFALGTITIVLGLEQVPSLVWCSKHRQGEGDVLLSHARTSSYGHRYSQS